MNDDTKDFFGFLGLAALLFAALTALFFALVYSGRTYECHRWHDITGDKTQMIVMDCYIYKNNQWQSLEGFVNHRKVDLNEEK